MTLRERLKRCVLSSVAYFRVSSGSILHVCMPCNISQSAAMPDSPKAVIQALLASERALQGCSLTCVLAHLAVASRVVAVWQLATPGKCWNMLLHA